MEDVEVAPGAGPPGPNASAAAWLIVSAPRLPPKTSRQRSPAAIPKRSRAARAVGGGDRRRDRPAGEQVAIALPSLDREREADPPRARREQPVGEAEVAVGLGQDERQSASQTAASPAGRGDVAAAAHHRVGAALAEERGAPTPTAARASAQRAGGPERVAAVDPAHVEEVDLVAGGGDQLGLGALAGADEADLGAALSERVGDGQRRHHVPRGPAGCDHHPRHGHLRAPRRGACPRAAAVEDPQPPAPARSPRARPARCRRAAMLSSSPTAARVTIRLLLP